MRHTIIFISFLILVPLSSISQGLNIDTSARPIIFETSFLNDTSYFDTFNPYRFYTVDLGKIKIESGKIIVCDPVELHIAEALEQEFPKGEFAVQLSILMDDDTSSKTVAYCRIKFSDKPVKKWTLALKPGEKERKVTEAHFNSFYYSGIGVGVGVIIDKVTSKILNKKSHTEWGNLFINKFNEPDKQGIVNKFNGHSLAAYNGFDGTTFRVYIGYDAQGNICRLLVDGGMYNIPITQF
jgi:Protein of unknown function (DUF4241)